MTENHQQPILSQIKEPRTLQLSIDSLSRGIDNYHIDVRLSKKFTSEVRKIVKLLMSQIAIPKPKSWDNSKLFEQLREIYIDVMTVLIHRVKTNLVPTEIYFLQSAATKYIISYVKKSLDEDISRVAAKTSELRNTGSTNALASDQVLFWLRKNYDTILYNVNKQIFNQLHRAENKTLAALRTQYLPAENQEFAELLFNPLLFVSNLSSPQLLINEYCMWDLTGQETGFVELNNKVEALFHELFEELPKSTLRNASPDEDSHSEIHDEHGGFLASQPFLGSSRDSKDFLEEHFDWLDDPATLQTVFDVNKHLEELAEIRITEGFDAWWLKRSEVHQLKKALTRLRKILKQKHLAAQLLSGYEVRHIWSPILAEKVELKIVCQFLSGQSGAKTIQEGISPGQRPSEEQIKFLEQIQERVQKQASELSLDTVLKILIEISRYRLHLKYYRFINRVFNRINILTKREDIQLSQDAGTIYSMHASNEIEDDEERISHHSILKADVRGSTLVTDELRNKGLNPASYFSLRFFDPLNKILDTYGAEKVFIEGDAIILSFLEHENSPQQWFSVARACGMAKELLTIVGLNNRHSTQMGLPILELGVGISYADQAPRFLFDEDKPIMISTAIGRADRLSSCSWYLRNHIKAGLFNVDVLHFGETERGKSEKEKSYLRYNVNGILIDNNAFSKLNDEINFNRLHLKINSKECVFYAGSYPDFTGKKRELIIREGTVRLWDNDKIVEIPDEDEKFYEVVVNRKVITLVIDSENKNNVTAI